MKTLLHDITTLFKSGLEDQKVLLSPFREQILRSILLIAALMGGLALISSTLASIREGEWLFMIFQSLMFVWLLLIALGTEFSYTFRVSSLLIILYGAGLVGLVESGLSGDGRILLFSMVIIATILTGLRGGLIAFGFVFVTFFIIGLGMSNGWIRLPSVSTLSNSGRIGSWLSGGAVLLTLTVISMGMITFIIRRLGELTRTKTDLVQQLKEEHSQLEDRVRERTIDLENEIERHQKTLKSLRENEAQYRHLVEQVDAVIYIDNMDDSSSFSYVSPQIEHLLGYTQKEWMEDRDLWLKTIHPADRERIIAEHLQTNENQEAFDIEYRLVSKDGRVIWVHDQAVFNTPADGMPPKWHGIIKDVTAYKQIEEALQDSELKFRSIIEQSFEGMLLSDEQGTLIETNKSFCEQYELKRDEILGKKIWDLMYELIPENRKNPENYQLYKSSALDILMTGTSHWIGKTMEENFTNQEGETCYISQTIYSIKTSKGYRIVVVSYDITERKIAEEQLRYLSTHDSLTGLFNRAFFEAESGRLENSRMYPISILMCDMDGLKAANDRLGHAAGDELLKMTAGVFSTTFRTGDIIARVGGDEFAVLLPQTDNDTAQEILARIRDNIHESMKKYPDLPLSVSLGIATAAEGINLEETLKRADERMYQDKAMKRKL